MRETHAAKQTSYLRSCFLKLLKEESSVLDTHSQLISSSKFQCASMECALITDNLNLYINQPELIVAAGYTIFF